MSIYYFAPNIQNEKKFSTAEVAHYSHSRPSRRGARVRSGPILRAKGLAEGFPFEKRKWFCEAPVKQKSI